MTTEEPAYHAIWGLLKEGKVVPVLGPEAALSGRTEESVWSLGAPNCLPNALELTKHLAQEARFPQAQPVDLAQVAQYARVVWGRPLLRQWLRTVFDRDYPYALLHELLAEVPSNLLILSMSYDDHLERALHARNHPFDLVIYPADNDEWRGSVLHVKHNSETVERVIPNQLHIDLKETTVIYKLHGAVSRLDASMDSFVIDEDDYAEFLVRAATKKAIPMIFSAHIRTRYLLYLGYSLYDWTFRVMLAQMEQHALQTHLYRLPGWVVQKGVSQMECKLWEKRNVTVYDMDIQEFVSGLRKAQLQQP